MKKVVALFCAGVLIASQVFAAEAEEEIPELLALSKREKHNYANSGTVDFVKSIGNQVDDSGKLDMKSTINYLSNQVLSNSINAYFQGKDAKDWMRRTEIQISFQDNWKPLYALETIQPLYEKERNTFFTQFRLSNASDTGTTRNLGFGYRHVSRANTSLYGANIFYDHGFKHNHARVDGFRVFYRLS